MVELKEEGHNTEVRKDSIDQTASQASTNTKQDMAQSLSLVGYSQLEEDASKVPVNQNCTEAGDNFNGVNLLRGGFPL